MTASEARLDRDHGCGSFMSRELLASVQLELLPALSPLSSTGLVSGPALRSALRGRATCASLRSQSPAG